MNKLNEIKKQRKRTANILGNLCVVCERKFGKGFHFHHKKYTKGEKTHKDFDVSASIKNWIQYNVYILPIIESKPKNYALLCNKHHKLVEILKQFKSERFENLVKIVRESK